uniref:hypothetical protein n=1 Tax=Clostridium sp. 12(A) TaxID=1163671 RepID=UPI00046389BA|nr:hypothetical protein [Clostridium sp. 12(A)]
MRYISDDNKVFDSEQECLDHEKVLNEEKFKREKLVAEKNRRQEEVIKSYKEFSDLLKRYSNDYDEPISVKNDLNVLSTFNRYFPGRILYR